MVKQEMARLNINILGISEIKWMRMGKFNSDDHFIYNCGQESCRRNGIALIVNKKVRQFLGAISKTTELSQFVSKGKPSNITVIQVYDTEETEVDWFYEDLQDLLELTPKKKMSFSSQGIGMQKQEVKRYPE